MADGGTLNLRFATPGVKARWGEGVHVTADRRFRVTRRLFRYGPAVAGMRGVLVLLDDGRVDRLTAGSGPEHVMLDHWGMVLVDHVTGVLVEHVEPVGDGDRSFGGWQWRDGRWWLVAVDGRLVADPGPLECELGHVREHAPTPWREPELTVWDYYRG